jgi:subtilisin family serine protease
VAFDYALYRGQADASAFELVLSVQALERGEQLVYVGHIEPDAVITDVVGDLAVFLHAPELDGRLGGVGHLYRFRSRSRTTEDLVWQFSSRPDVLYAEPNYLVQAVQQPNDPRFAELWGLHNTGQGFGFPPGTAGADIGALEAWSFSTGNTSHVVAVVDTGIDYTHPDLQANIWSAPAAFAVTIAGSVVNCPAGSHGFNAIALACDPMDDNKHGTHVSGTIGALGNNGQGVVGVNWTTRLMGIKFLDFSGYGYIADAVNAIEFAIQAKNAFGAAADVRVLSNSWGGGGFSQALLDEIKRAGDNNMLFVAAAGNNGYNNDLSAFYPAGYNAPNLLAVAATDNNDSLASFSNYGPTSVQLGAPGVNILSTVLGGQYGYLSGTSMAAPHVSGAAALVLSRCPLDTSALKASLTEQVDLVPALNTITASGGRLNVNNALRDCTAPVGVSPGALAFARQVVSTLSPPKTVTVTNRQTRPLTLAGITAEGDFRQSNNCGQEVAAGGACKITVTFIPTAEGYATGALTVTHGAANSPQSVPLSGYGIVPTTVTPLNINFAGVVLGSSSRAQYVKLTNNQPTPLTIIGITMTGAFTQTNSCGTTLAALQSCNVLVIFTPVALGAHAGVLTLNYNASNSPQTVTLAGTGASRVTLSPPTLDFGAVVVGNTSLRRSASLMNNQKNATLGITSIIANGDFTQTNNCGTQLGPSLTCVISVTFKPSAMGLRSGSVVITSNVPESPHVLALSGTGLGQPDLIESSVSALGTLAAGKSTQVSDTTVNRGTGNAGSSTTRYYLSTTVSSTPAGVLLSGSRAVPALAAGGSSNGTATVTVSPYVPAGSYYVLACADANNYVVESNKNNNCAASSPVRVTAQ